MDTYFIPKLFLGPFETTLRSKVQIQQHNGIIQCGFLAHSSFSHQIFTILTRGNISFKKTIKNFIHECIFHMFNRLLKKFSHQGRINILICPKNLFDPIVNSDIVLRANTFLVDFPPDRQVSLLLLVLHIEWKC